MAVDIIKLYVSLLSEFFVFSDMAVMAPTPTGGRPAPLLPDDSTSLTTAHYLMKILTEIQDNVNEINSMEISGEVGTSLRGLLDSAKWGFEDVLVHAWVRGMSMRVSRGVISRDISSDCRYRCACVPLLGKLGLVLIRAVHN
jgi:exocyst complex component 2